MVYRRGTKGRGTRVWGTRGCGPKRWDTKGRGRTTRGWGGIIRGWGNIRSVGHIANGELPSENGIDEYVGNERCDPEPVLPLDDVGVHVKWSRDGDLH